MKTIEFCGQEHTVESWWKFITCDEDGWVCLFYEEPIYAYYKSYKCGRMWDTPEYSTEWQEQGYVDGNFHAGQIKRI